MNDGKFLTLGSDPGHVGNHSRIARSETRTRHMKFVLELNSATDVSEDQTRTCRSVCLKKSYFDQNRSDILAVVKEKDKMDVCVNHVDGINDEKIRSKLVGQVETDGEVRDVTPVDIIISNIDSIHAGRLRKRRF